MKRSIRLIAVVSLAALVLSLVGPPVMAGRIGGPTSMFGTAPAGTSVYYDISFAADAPAIVTITGNGKSQMFVLIYDSDGHAVIGTGVLDHRTAVMNVYRSGVFRVEVRNLGVLDNSFRLTTN